MGTSSLLETSVGTTVESQYCNSVDTVADVLNLSVHSDSVASEFVVVSDECVGCFV